MIETTGSSLLVRCCATNRMPGKLQNRPRALETLKRALTGIPRDPVHYINELIMSEGARIAEFAD
jgi:hypothetical protein